MGEERRKVVREEVHKLYWYEQCVPQWWIPSIQHWQASRWSVRVPGAKLFGCLLPIQPDQNTHPRQGENNIYHWRCQLLFQDHALWPKKCRHYILEIDGSDLQTTDRMQHRGLCWRHGPQVSEHSLTHGRLRRGLRRALQIRHVPQLGKCTFRVDGGKFLGFMITHRGIEADPNKCTAILAICNLTIF